MTATKPAERPQSAPSLEEDYALLKVAAREAGELALPYFRKSILVKRKMTRRRVPGGGARGRCPTPPPGSFSTPGGGKAPPSTTSRSQQARRARSTGRCSSP